MKKIIQKIQQFFKKEKDKLLEMPEFLNKEEVQLILEENKGKKCPNCHTINLYVDARIFYLRSVNLTIGKPVYLVECGTCDLVMQKNIPTRLIKFMTAHIH